MVAILTSSPRVSASFFENNGVFCSNSRRELFLSFGLLDSRRFVNVNPKKSRMTRVFCLNLSAAEANTPPAGGGILSTDFEFKPSFDDYLKAMESVKSERSKKEIHKLSREKVADDGSKVKNEEIEEDDLKLSERSGFSGKNYEKSVKFGEFGKFSGDEKSYKVTKLHVESENDRFNRRNLKREMVCDTDLSDMSKVKVRISRGEELGLTGAKCQIQIRRITDERNALRSGKLTRNSRGSSVRVDDCSLDVVSPAFKFFDESKDVVDQPRVSRMEMEDRIQKLAKGLNGADINMPEWMFSKSMRSAKIRFSDHSILRVIQILGKYGNWRRVLQVIEWLQRRERFKSNRLRHIYTAALDVLGKSRRPVEALNIFNAMQQQMASYPDLVAYHSITVTLGQAGHIKELFDVIDTMRSPPKKKFKTATFGKWDPRLEPDIVVYNAVLNACVHQKQWEGAFWVLQQLRQQRQKPSSATYGLVMEVMLACGKYNLVHDFFRKMQKSSIPTSQAYRVLVNTLWKEGKTEEAEQAVRDMERRGIVGSAALYYDLARCLCSAGRCKEGLKLIEKICKVANRPLVVTYTGLMQACLDSGSIQDGAYIFNQMKDFCSPNLVTCNIMLKAYLEHGLFEEAGQLFKNMSEDENCISVNSDHKSRVLPDTFTFDTMLDACAENGRWDDFEYVYRRMLHHGYHFKPKRHLRMILGAGRAGKAEVVERTWEHLNRGDRTPPAPLIKERFCLKLEKGDQVSAILSVTNLEDDHSELRDFSKSAWLKLLKENAHRFRKDVIFLLMEDLNKVGSENEQPKQVLKNLLMSCKDFLRTYDAGYNLSSSRT